MEPFDFERFDGETDPTSFVNNVLLASSLEGLDAQLGTLLLSLGTARVKARFTSLILRRLSLCASALV
jgi:hypothetical protein